jgi:hypothetical protein
VRAGESALRRLGWVKVAARAWGASAALVVVVLLALTAPGARAGVWAQVSCINPDGSAAPSTGWTTFTAGAGSSPEASSACGPGTPMSAVLSDAQPAPVFDTAGLMYTPPPGSTLIGGTLQVALSADGGGTGAAADAEIDEPAQTSADARLRCTAGSRSCGASATDVSGTFTMPADLGGNLYLTAGCTGTGGFTCDAGSRENAWAFAQVSSAVLLLQNTASPAARRARGTLLGRAVHGRARLRLLALDPGGPGVYRIAVMIDGRIVHDAVPDRNGGACVPVGIEPVTGALEFDAAQPCPSSVTATLHIPTVNLPDGPHQLAVSVTDAAGNTATVLRRRIATLNPQLTPRPARGLRSRFAISWRWERTVTVLRTISARDVPRSATVRVACSGRKCPSLPAGAVPGAHLRPLLRQLRDRRLHPGDALLITVTAAHRPPVRIRVAIRRSARPQPRLLPSRG